MPEPLFDAAEMRSSRDVDVRLLFDDNLAAIFIASPEDHIQMCNPAFARLFGFASVNEAIGASLRLLYPEDVLAQRLVRVKMEGSIDADEAELRRIDGQPLHVLDRLVGHFDARGLLAGYTGFVIDDTPRQALQVQLRHAMKMASIGRLAVGVAHDFNNLLMIIIGLSEGLLEQVAPDDPLRPELDQILDAGRRGSSLAAQILAVSRKATARPSVFDVEDALKSMQPLIARLLGHGISLQFERTPGKKWVTADREQLEQVLLNLATNAHDAMPGGGRLTIATSVSYDEQHVLIRVIDTGTGMSAETQARIFEPFYTTKPHGKGTGLGLAQVHGLLSENGGTIDVQSTLGVGTTFTISLALASETSEVGAIDLRRISARHDTETVLVVDDEAPVRALICGALERLGYRVLLAENTTTALAVVREHVATIDLLVTDVVMPGRSGHDLAREFAVRVPTVPILFMSGYPEHVLEVDGRPLPADASFLQKPFTLEALALRIRELLDGPRPH
jgi:PAS domain S-box-containing protein